MSAVAPTIESFFTDRLITQRDASPHTIGSYRDTFRLLLGFAHDRTGKAPSQLDFVDLDATLVAAFLTHPSGIDTTAWPPETPGCRRSARCSATPRCAIPNTPS